MNYSYLALLCGWSIAIKANDFVVKESPKKVSPSQLKQDVLTKMGELLELETQVLEVSAQIQQKLCKDIRASLEGLSASRVRLTKLHELLSQEYKRLNEHKAAQKRFLASLH